MDDLRDEATDYVIETVSSTPMPKLTQVPVTATVGILPKFVKSSKYEPDPTEEEPEVS